MLKRIVLALVCVAAFGAASVATPDTADASWRYRGRPSYGYYYGGPRYYSYRRPYYRSYYRPYRSYYYGGPGYYGGYGGYYGGRGYYGGYGGYYPRSGVTFSFGW